MFRKHEDSINKKSFKKMKKILARQYIRAILITLSNGNKVGTEPVKRIGTGENPESKVDIQAIKETLKAKKGANLSVVFDRQLKTRKGVTEAVTKVTRIVARGGVEYDNLSVVKEKRENGELPSENAGLPWGEWVEFPLHIRHKDVDYARFYPASGIGFKPQVSYFLDGVEVSKEQVQPLCLASEFPKRDEEPLCFTIKAHNVAMIRE
jgi:hypothetical protein